MKKEFKLNEKIGEFYTIPVKHVKEFIRRDWTLTNHFLWDLFRKWKINEDVIEEEITKLSEKKDKLSGELG